MLKRNQYHSFENNSTCPIEVETLMSGISFRDLSYYYQHFNF